MTDRNDWASETEARLLDAALAKAPRLGWTARLVAAAGREVGLTGPESELLLPGGPRDLAALYARRLDAAVLLSLAEVDPATLKIRERIRRAVLAWLDEACADLGATRRWTGFLALPPNHPLGLRLAWASADALWRWAGDTATDENHYSKRGLLAEILISSLAMRLAHGAAVAEAHLDRRIAGVMRFETWKAGLELGDPLRRAAAFLARVRYGRGSPEVAKAD